MTSARSMLTLPLILLCLSGCATRTIAVAECAKPAPLTARQQVPAPDPLLFRQCWEETKAQTASTSPPALTPSCERLNSWTSSIESASDVSVPVAPYSGGAPACGFFVFLHRGLVLRPVAPIGGRAAFWGATREAPSGLFVTERGAPDPVLGAGGA